VFEEGRSSFGCEENITATASYAYLLGVIVLFLEKKSNFARFHAVQSTLGFVLLTILVVVVKVVPALAWMWWLPGLLMLIFAGVGMLKAYDGEEFKAPLIGNLAHSLVFSKDDQHDDLLATPPDPGEDESTDSTRGS